MALLQVLQDARTLIANRENWTKGENARDHKGMAVETEDPRAVCFCAEGAIRRASGDRLNFEAIDALCAVTRGAKALWRWNDVRGRTHSQVLAAFDRAIELALASTGERTAP